MRNAKKSLQSRISEEWHELKHKTLKKVSSMCHVLSGFSRRRLVCGACVGEMVWSLLFLSLPPLLSLAFVIRT